MAMVGSLSLLPINGLIVNTTVAMDIDYLTMSVMGARSVTVEYYDESGDLITKTTVSQTVNQIF